MHIFEDSLQLFDRCRVLARETDQEERVVLGPVTKGSSRPVSLLPGVDLGSPNDNPFRYVGGRFRVVGLAIMLRAAVGLQQFEAVTTIVVLVVLLAADDVRMV
jgi:hypothetical protein